MLRDNMRWILYSDFLMDEYRQCEGEGRDVADLAYPVREVLAMDASPEKERKAKELVLRLEARPFRNDLHTKEPERYDEILRLLPDDCERVYAYDRKRLDEKLAGAWYGRLAGCLLGIPVEDWPRPRVESYLRESGAWPLEGYLTGKVPGALRKKYGVTDFDPGTPYDRQSTCWIEHIGGFPVDDDINYMLLALKVLERFGRAFTPGDVAQTWLWSLPGFHACTSERAAYRNLMNGVLPPDSAVHGNPFREMIGAQIRADLFGYVCPGDPHAAARLAYRDASVSHVKNGVYGEMFIAAVLSLCYCDGMDMPELVEAALRQIPPESRLSLSVREVLAHHRAGGGHEELVQLVHGRYREDDFFDWCSVVPNCMLVTVGILYHADDYSAAIRSTVLSGFDTDCNGATVGSVVGLHQGIGGIDRRWLDPVKPTVSSGVHGYEFMTVDEAVRRTRAII